MVQPEGKARLHHTINLIKEMVATTLEDTEKLAPVLKGSTLRATCRNIWNFVYNHIQYKPDRKGIEQVRRPSRIWDERKTGCDCDCMTVMICSLLTHLNIENKIRITKYRSKNNPWLIPRYQHIYPIVPVEKGRYITMDCVTDWFDYEVPFLEKRDFAMNDGVLVGTIEGIPGGFSGVDSLALREVITCKTRRQNLKEKNHTDCPSRAVNPAVYINICSGDSSPAAVKEPLQVKQDHAAKQLVSVKTPAPRVMEQSRSILPASVHTADQQVIHTRPNTTVKNGGVMKKVLIAGVVGIGTYHLIKILT